MKIVEFFKIIWGKWYELEPEPEFLTSWSRSWSRTKMDRLRNTAYQNLYGTVPVQIPKNNKAADLTLGSYQLL
jgi:hypothetical protein